MSLFGGGQARVAELTGGEGKNALHLCRVLQPAFQGFPRPGLVLLVLCLSRHQCPGGVCSCCLEASRTALAALALRDVGSPHLGPMLGTSRDASMCPTVLLLQHVSPPSPAADALQGGDRGGCAGMAPARLRLPLPPWAALRELCQPVLAFPILSGVDGKPIKIHLLTQTGVVVSALLQQLNFTDPQNKQPFQGCFWNQQPGAQGRQEQAKRPA